jgi:hypothetical protein
MNEKQETEENIEEVKKWIHETLMKHYMEEIVKLYDDDSLIINEKNEVILRQPKQYDPDKLIPFAEKLVKDLAREKTDSWLIQHVTELRTREKE